MKHKKRNLRQRCAFVMTEGPMLTQHHHPEATGDASGHAWCCASCVLGRMFNDTCPFGDSSQESAPLPLPCP